jgi:hypothetical protein
VEEFEGLAERRTPLERVGGETVSCGGRKVGSWKLKVEKLKISRV